jgi:tellurite resistance protein TehA-like permease
MAWPLLAQALNRDVLGKEHLFSSWYTPLMALAVVGFVTGVLGHLFSSKTMVVAGLSMVFVALLLFPIFLYARGTP